MTDIALTQVIQFLIMYRDKGIWSYDIEDKIVSLIFSINSLPKQKRIEVFIDKIESI